MTSHRVWTLLLSTLSALTLWVDSAAAQTDWDVSGLMAAPTLSQFDATDYGVGGRGSYRLTDRIAVEGELTFYPRDLTGGTPFSGNRVEGLFGVKVGTRFDKLGVFAKARPGFLRFAEAPSPVACILIFPAPLSCQLATGQTILAVDVGGGVEVLPTSRTVFRVDVSDNILRYKGPVLSADGEAFPDGGFWSHNLRIAVSGGVRFPRR